MASNTPNLNLYKKDPIADGNDTFNITTMLNENWDKIDTSVAEKVDKVSGKQLSTNDYTTTEKLKLAGIAAGANNTTVNNTLTSTSTTAALSAAQGKVLKDLVDTKANNTNLTSLQQTVAQHLDDYTQYFVRARNTLAQSIPSNIWTNLVFNMYDNTHEGMFTPSSTSTTISIVKEGVYLIGGNISYSLSGTQGVAGLRVLNNADIIASAVNFLPQDRAIDLNIATIIHLKVGDTLKLQAYQTSGVALSSNAGSKSVPHFTVKKVG